MVFDGFFKAAKEYRTSGAAKKEAKEKAKDEAKRKSEEASKRNKKKSKKKQNQERKRPGSSTSPASQPQPKRQRRSPPSEQALDLSRKLKDCSLLKQLDEALQLYEANKPQVDEHHACILIDCCARCGNVETAVRISQDFIHNASVETVTALLKAYSAHGGYMKESIELFQRTVQQANVRTLNTILRGCLWSAVDIEGFGGVKTSEAAWDLYTKHHSVNQISVGTTAFECTILLLCQALRVTDAQQRIQLCMKTFKVEYKGAGSFHLGSTEQAQTIFETMAVAHAALARSYALLCLPEELWKASQRALNSVKLSRQYLLNESAATTSSKQSGKSKNNLSGGKQGWRRSGRTEEAETARANSNQLYRKHRLDEIEQDVKHLIKLRAKLPTTNQTAKLLGERLWYAPGGGSTRASPQKGLVDLADSSDTGAWESFGLSRIEQVSQGGKNKKKANTIMRTHANFLGEDGRLDLPKLFGNGNRVEMEIGAGFGSWIVHQAKQLRDRNYIAIEMKADRVAQIVTRCALEHLSNVSIVGGDCLYFMETHLPLNSLANVYANHPEPPTQTFGMYDRERLDRIAGGDAAAEPSHMLTSKAILQIGNHLIPKSGRFTIVTDNRNYVRLLTSTAACAITRATGLISVGPKFIRNSALKLIESPSFASITVHVYEGKMGQGNGTSYFDKLWNTGAGSHAEKTARFVVVLERRGHD